MIVGLSINRKWSTCGSVRSKRFRAESWSKERGTRVKDSAKNGASKKALVSILAQPKPKIPLLSLSLLWNQPETLATQATVLETAFLSQIKNSNQVIWIFYMIMDFHFGKEFSISYISPFFFACCLLKEHGYRLSTTRSTTPFTS